MLVCIGGGDWVGPALCRLCPDIHSHTLYSGGKRDAPGAPSTQIKEGCATPLWAHLRDYQRENATSPVLGGGPGCNCVLSDLQSPPHSFVPDIFLHWIYFSLFGVLAAAPLVTKFSSFLPPCAPRANDRKCVQIALCMKRERYPHQEKVTRSNWWTDARDFFSSSLYDSLAWMRLAVQHSSAKIEIATEFSTLQYEREKSYRSSIYMQDYTYHKVMCVCVVNQNQMVYSRSNDWGQ